MSILFDQIVFGPIRSRRLGASLGINLLPLDSKLCNFNCIYCECGWNKHGETPSRFYSSDVVLTAIKTRLATLKLENILPDAITFSGNGEPTMHPEFLKIIDGVIAIRDEMCPTIQIAVLSNATRIHLPEIFEALLKIEKPILKLDSAIQETVQLIDQPQGRYTVNDTLTNLLRFNGRFTLQTMFLKGTYQGKDVDNTSEIEIDAWLKALLYVTPQFVTIYTVDRDTPEQDLHKISKDQLEDIANKARTLGFEVQVSC